MLGVSSLLQGEAAGKAEWLPPRMDDKAQLAPEEASPTGSVRMAFACASATRPSLLAPLLAPPSVCPLPACSGDLGALRL